MLTPDDSESPIDIDELKAELARIDHRARVEGEPEYGGSPHFYMRRMHLLLLVREIATLYLEPENSPRLKDLAWHATFSCGLLGIVDVRIRSYNELFGIKLEIHPLHEEYLSAVRVGIWDRVADDFEKAREVYLNTGAR